MTFFVTPGALSGRHLHPILRQYNGCFLPNVSSGHWLFHPLVKSVTALASEDIIDLDSTVAFTRRDIFIVPIKTHAKRGLRDVTECVLVSDFETGVFLVLDKFEFGRARSLVLLCRSIGHHGWKEAFF